MVERTTETGREGRVTRMNRPLTIYTAANRKAAVLQAAPIDVQGLFDRLRASQTLPVAYDAYMRLTKAKQDDLKDVGAYIAGELRGGRRRAGNVLMRCAGVLDGDNLSPGGADELIRRVVALGVRCCIHSTAKHTPVSPRLRVVVPFAADITADQYAPVVRLLCQAIQPELTWFDPSTDQAGRLMYWPSHCQDIEPIYVAVNGPLLDAAVLLDRLQDWHDMTSWPHFPREQAISKGAIKQQDPESKDGLIGAFCRVYDVPGAMDRYLPGVYEPTAQEDRYTFVAGSTWGGAVIYENRKFLYSHHATDPAGGRLVNAFDLVRLHLYGEQDDETKEGTPTNRLPSYTAMCQLAKNDSAVSHVLAREVFEAADLDSGMPITSEEAAAELCKSSGRTLNANIVRLALKAWGIQVRRNLITGTAEITGMPPQYSKENAANTLPVFLMDVLREIGVKGVSRTTLIDYLANIMDENRYNPVLDMLSGTKWDGATRLPALLGIIGVAPDSLEASLVQKWLIQCVAMAHNTTERREAAEGVLTLQGEQRIGKTLFFRRLSIHSEWFAEGVTLDMKNKDDVLRATGAWITELGELDSTLKREQSSLKAFITSPYDRIRAPYAREASANPRRTSFCATVNPACFLKDDTGDRRFWVVKVDRMALQALISLPDEWFIQLWSEAVTWWRANPQGFRLSQGEKCALDDSNRQFREALPGEEEIRLALNFELPVERWGEFSASQLQSQLYTALDRVSSSQVGRALAKLEREDERLKSRTLHGIRLYRLPIPRTIGLISDAEKG